MKLKNSILVVILICTFVISLSPTDMLAQDGVQCQDEYTVQQGDWLSKIAEKYLGDAFVYELIVQANNAQNEDSYPDITDPDLIEPGWLLCIPQVSSTPETEVENNSNRAEDVKLIEFKTSSGQFSLSYPEAWTMVEYEDGSGVILANSGESLTRYQQGLAPASGDQVLNISLTPTVLFQSLYIQVAPGMSAEELAGTLS